MTLDRQLLATRAFVLPVAHTPLATPPFRDVVQGDRAVGAVGTTVEGYRCHRRAESSAYSHLAVVGVMDERHGQEQQAGPTGATLLSTPELAGASLPRKARPDSSATRFTRCGGIVILYQQASRTAGLGACT